MSESTTSAPTGAVVQPGAVPPAPVNPTLTLTSPVVVVKKSYTNPRRQKVTLKTSSTFARTGTLTRSSDAIRFFDAVTGGKEITFNGIDNVFAGARLTAGVDLFAQGERASAALNDVQLTLTLTTGTTPIGPAATATMTSVGLTLDISEPPFADIDPDPLLQPPPTPPPAGTAKDKFFGGVTLFAGKERSLLIVRRVQPAAFSGDLVLRQVKLTGDKVTGLDNKVAVLDNTTAASVPKNNPHQFNTSTFPPAPGDIQFRVQGVRPSTVLRDTGFQLGIKGVEEDGDRVSVTVGVAPLIDLGTPNIGGGAFGVLVKKPHTNPARKKVTIKTTAAFNRSGTFTVSSTTNAVRFFDQATGGNPVVIPSAGKVFMGSQLTSGVDLFVEGANPSAVFDDIELKLSLQAGGTGSVPVAPNATESMTAVELTLDICASRTAPGVDPTPLLPPVTPPAPGTVPNDKWFGGRFLAVQDAAKNQERALLIIRAVKPSFGFLAGLANSLVLRQVEISGNKVTKLDTKVQVFTDEDPKNPGAALGNSLDVPLTGAQFFVEGSNLSKTLRDTGFQLGFKDLDDDGDRISLTVGTFKLRTQNAVQIGDRSSRIFATTQAAAQNVTVIADIKPTLSAAQASLVTWTGGTSTANLLQRNVSRAVAAQTAISATFAGATLSLEILVLADPSTSGSFSVGNLEYTEVDEGTFAVQMPGAPPGVTFPVRRRAIVRYPANAAGVNVPVSNSQANYPLVIILHGNHRRFLPSPPNPPGTFVESYRGLDYLATHLASHGYIALSIDVDDINGPQILIEARGEAILEHIIIMKRRNASFSPATDRVDFTGKVDTSFMGLIGHSRGGEGVVSAQQLNISRGLGHLIKGVISIAPTNLTNFVHNSTPYLVIYGSADGDVRGSEDGVNPFLLYDRATAPKALIFVYGAIHNRFSTNADWLDPTQIDNDDARMISAADHLNIAKGYCLAFFERHLRSQQQGFDIFFHDYKRPNSVAATVAIHHSYQDRTTLVIDNFEQPSLVGNRALTNTLSQTVSGSGLAKPTGSSDDLTEVLLRRAVTTFFVHDSFGAMIAWISSGATYTSNLGAVDASKFQVLSFRVTQRLGSARNPAAAAQDFVVRLTDTANQSASIRVGTVTDIPFPFERHNHLTVHPPPLGPPTRFVDALPDEFAFSKSALKTIRLRLDDFVINNPLLNLNALQKITFEFSRTAKGEIAVDDIEFSL